MKTFIAQVMINQEMEPVEIKAETITEASEDLRNRYGISTYIASIEEVISPDALDGGIAMEELLLEETEEEEPEEVE